MSTSRNMEKLRSTGDETTARLYQAALRHVPPRKIEYQNNRGGLESL